MRAERKKPSDRLGRLSLANLAPDEALAGAMQVTPHEEVKPKKQKGAKKRKRKKKAR